VAVHFEAELSNYFEKTMHWHGQPGALNTRPGFRLLEFYEELFFGFMVPFWEQAVAKPACLVHFYVQFGFLLPVVQLELRILSKELPGQRAPGIQNFISKYPILFELLETALAT
jgi:hypothetical protein